LDISIDSADDDDMISFPSTETTLRAYTFRPYDDQWHGSQWDEAALHEELPSLSQVLRGLLRRPAPKQTTRG
jgi:hypothetical protein